MKPPLSALTLNRPTLFLTAAVAAGLAACGKFAPAKRVKVW